MVYILEFDRPMHHAKYYIGYCNEGKLDARMHYHRSKRGARITAAAVEQGIGFNVIYTFPGADRNFERKLKNRKNTPKLVESLRRQGLIT